MTDDPDVPVELTRQRVPLSVDAAAVSVVQFPYPK
jgi:hypothetical protein